MSRKQVSGETIGAFLDGSDPQKYIVAIEAPYFQNTVSLVINDPVKGKYIQKASYKPFLWLKHDVSSIMYGGDRAAIVNATKKFNVKITLLKTSDENNYVPKRMENGFKYIAKCDGSYTELLNFFKEGGIDVFNENFRPYFMTISPTEQFLIQTGKRLFKGFEEYDDLHRFQFDLETTGLFHNINSIFQVGIKDNRGFERVIEVKVPDVIQDALDEAVADDGTVTPDQMVRLQSLAGKELRESERQAIAEFFEVIDELKPDIIAGYNSENFDWDFIYGRCDILGMDITKVAKTLNDSNITRRDSQLKLGGNVEHYQQTQMWGYNIVDVMHAVRRAQAINSDIKKAGLKYITKFSKIAKPNRVYVEGNVIHKTWSDRKNDYYLNDSNGEWFKFNALNQEHVNILESPENAFKKVTGAYIVQRYLIDDLWETEQIDARFNQASFLLGKWIPTSYMRSSTMGTAGIWKLIMMAWSYEHNLAIPDLQPQETFTGGLSRLLEVGFAKNVAKLDYAALYPNTEITHDIFPDIDISGVMKGFLLYIAETRDIYKAMKGQHEENADNLKKEIEANKETYSKVKLAELEKQRQVELGLADKFDKKQLPIKILANSFFGSFGAPHLFPWGDLDCAEETTCRGRQYLRLMVKHFHEKHGFRPLVGDTDGFNFAIPDDVEKFKYHPTGEHRLTEKYKGTELSGLKAVVAEFNEVYMEGRMGLDVDAVCETTINFARKNYANEINGKVKLVGNTIKSKKMPIYIEEFLDEGIKLLLKGEGYEFIELYNKTVEKIVNYDIPLVKIASKSSVRKTMAAYKAGMTKKNKAGNPMPRQAHMELAVKHGLDLNLGDTIYYVNIGTTKSQGDIKTIKNPNGTVEVELMCKLIPTDQIEENPDLTTDEYNAPKYLAAFNKRIHPLLVCFEPEIRDQILVDFKKNTKTKQMELVDFKFFTRKDTQLCSGNPFNEGDQDSYEDFMQFEDKELAFWTRVNKVPNHIEVEEWNKIKEEYVERTRVERLLGIETERQKIEEILMRLEVDDLQYFKYNGVIPEKLAKIMSLHTEGEDLKLMSLKFNDITLKLSDVFKYEKEALEREKFYMERPTEALTYDDWVKSNELAADDNGEAVEYYSEKEVVEEPVVATEEVEMETQLNVEEEEDDWGF